MQIKRALEEFIELLRLDGDFLVLVIAMVLNTLITAMVLYLLNWG